MNTKHPLYKEKLRVQREISELNEMQRNQNWVELETPYKSGYYKTLDLRDDIKNRQDAWVFYECISLVGQQVWWKNKSFKYKLRKGKFEYISVGFGSISEEAYVSLKPAVKKYFSEVGPWSRLWNPFRKKYTCSAPSFYFVDKIVPKWITHYKEHDSEIARLIDEKEDYLRHAKFWPINGWYGGAPKDFVKDYNRSDRRNSKQTLHRNMNNNELSDCYDDFNFDKGEDFEYYEYSYYYDRYEYRYAHKHSAVWDYW